MAVPLDRRPPRSIKLFDLDWKFRSYQATILTVIFGPYILVPTMIYLYGMEYFRWVDAITWFITHNLYGFGVTIGLHRYFTHRAFKAKRGVIILLIVFALMALEGKITEWVPNHVYHHAHSDEKGVDLHSPRDGFWFSHFLWLLSRKFADVAQWSPWLLEDPWIVRLDRLFPLFALLSFVIPTGIGAAWEWFFSIPEKVVWSTFMGVWYRQDIAWGAFIGFVWGVWRMFTVHNITWAVNSLGHTFGDMPYKSTEGDQSRNIPMRFLFAPWATLGELWHRTHHAFPWSALQGTSKVNDWSFSIICFLGWLGWVWAIRVPTPEQLEAKRIKPLQEVA